MQQTSFYCPQCDQMKLFQRETMNHTPHILATVFLCGLWLPIWILIAIGFNPPWRCSFCGYADSERFLRDPELAKREHAQQAVNERISREAAAEREAEYRETIAGAIGLSEKIPIWVSYHKQETVVFILIFLAVIAIASIAIKNSM